MATTRLQILVDRLVKQQLTDPERKELEQLLISSNAHDVAAEVMEVIPDSPVMPFDEAWLPIVQKAMAVDSNSDIESSGKTIFRSLIPGERFLRKWGWAAASVIIVLGIGVYRYSISKKADQSLTHTPALIQTDITPGTNKAVLTVDNKRIDLSSDKTGIAVGNTVTYIGGEKLSETGQVLQLTTPRGGQYQLVLPDGTKVWLNAASSIKFPSKFKNNERRVEVSGEVYMEVAKKLNAAFSVSTENTTIQVLGTSFNINAYPEEENQKTTLISGSVKVSSNNQEAILKPGQQASIPIIPVTKIKQITVQTADIDQVLAWKNGLFDFENASIETIMGQLQRWYNIEVEYRGKVHNTFKGTFSKTLPVKTILERLQMTNYVHFETDGRKIIVKP